MIVDLYDCGLTIEIADCGLGSPIGNLNRQSGKSQSPIGNLNRQSQSQNRQSPIRSPQSTDFAFSR
jgi:hypothetical protein